MSLWNYLLAALASLSAEPNAVERERPKAAAAVAIAYAQFAQEEPVKQAPPAAQPECKDGKCPPPKGVVKP